MTVSVDHWFLPISGRCTERAALDDPAQGLKQTAVATGHQVATAVEDGPLVGSQDDVEAEVLKVFHIGISVSSDALSSGNPDTKRPKVRSRRRKGVDLRGHPPTVAGCSPIRNPTISRASSRA